MKKIVTIILCALVALNLCVSAAAFSPQTVKSLHPLFAQQIADITLDGGAIEPSELEALEARPGSTLEIVLAGTDSDTDLFFDQNGLPVNTADVTISKMRATKVAVSADAREGANLLRSVELGVKNAGSPASRPVISINFINDFASVEPAEFSFDIFISIGGQRQEQSRLTIAGELRNDELSVPADASSVILDGTVIIVAEDDIPSIEIDAGCGVTIEASMSAGGRYLVVASESGGTEDLDMFTRYSKLVSIINLDVAGFEPGQIKSVRIDSEQLLYVYDSDGRNAGMTGQRLPLSEKYYLASKAIEF